MMTLSEIKVGQPFLWLGIRFTRLPAPASAAAGFVLCEAEDGERVFLRADDVVDEVCS